MSRIRLSLIASSACLLFACTNPMAYEPFEPFAHQEELDSSHLEISNPVFAGDIGPTIGFDQVAALDLYRTPSWSEWTMTVDTPSGAAMAIFWLEGARMRDLLDIEGSMTFDSYFGSRDGGMFLSAVGCAGDEPGDWQYDEPAETVDVVVIPGDDDNEGGGVAVEITLNIRDPDTDILSSAIGSLEMDLIEPELEHAE